MKARLLEDSTSTLCILCSDGSILDVDKRSLRLFLTAFKTIEGLGGGKRKWKNEYPDMAIYPGKEYARVTDSHQLIIQDFKPFNILWSDQFPSDMLTTSEYAEKHNKSVEQIKVLCRKGRIPGALMMGRNWMIPSDAPYPVLRRTR